MSGPGKPTSLEYLLGNSRLRTRGKTAGPPDSPTAENSSPDGSAEVTTINDLPTTKPRSTDAQAIATYLEDLSTRILEAHRPVPDETHLAFIRSHSVPNFQVRILGQLDEPMRDVSTLDDHLSNWTAYRKQWPDWVFIITQGATAAVGAACRHAAVWVTVAGGHPWRECDRIEAMSVLYWRKEKVTGQWVRVNLSACLCWPGSY